MSRPTAFEDLSPYDQRGQEVASIDYATLFSLSWKTIVRVLKASEALNREVEDGRLVKEGEAAKNDTVSYKLQLTDEEREQKLLAEQRRWDALKARYEDALTDPDSVPQWARYGVNLWAKEEGKPAIDWENGK